MQFEAEVGGRQAWCQKLASRVLELACEAKDFEGLLALMLEDYPTIVEIDDFRLVSSPPVYGLSPKPHNLLRYLPVQG